jgi:hypothetical protein
LRGVGEKGRWRIEGQAPAKQLSLSATASSKPPFSYTARLSGRSSGSNVR